MAGCKGSELMRKPIASERSQLFGVPIRTIRQSDGSGVIAPEDREAVAQAFDFPCAPTGADIEALLALLGGRRSP